MYCEDTNSRGTYSEFAILLPIFILLLVLLLCDTIRNECTQKTLMRRIDIKIRASFIFVQVIALYFMISDLLRFTIDPYTFILRGHFGCKMVALSHKIGTLAFYSIYFYHIIIRLQHCFKDSMFALSRCTIITLHLFNVVPVLTLVPIVVILDQSTIGCIKRWRPPDIDMYAQSDTLSYCASPIAPVDAIAAAIALLWIVASNIIYAIIFGKKLKKLLAFASSEADTLSDNEFNCKVIGIKVTILTLFGAISTVVNHVLWMVMNLIGYILGVGTAFGLLDLVMNCYAIGLMFTSNERYYKQTCKCCLLCCCKKNGQKNQLTEYLETRVSKIDSFDMCVSGDTTSGVTTTLVSDTL
eukprot:27595_1